MISGNVCNVSARGCVQQQKVHPEHTRKGPCSLHVKLPVFIVINFPGSLGLSHTAGAVKKASFCDGLVMFLGLCFSLKLRHYNLHQRKVINVSETGRLHENDACGSHTFREESDGFFSCEFCHTNPIKRKVLKME